MSSLTKTFVACLLGSLLPSPAVAQGGGTWTIFHQFDGVADNNNLGYSVAGAGDVDGDGCDDVIVGAPYPSGAGAAYVYSGASGGILWTFTGVGGLFGYSVAGAGDVDADGYPDLLVGAPVLSPGGSVYVFSGGTGSQLCQFSGATVGEYFGGAVAGAGGDLDLDGYDDWVVGAPYANLPGAPDAGLVYVFSGCNPSFIHSVAGASGDRLGYSVASAGDVDTDQINDLILGAIHASPGGLLYAGSAFVYSGATFNLIHRYDGLAGGDRFGRSVSGAGDLDGDGYGDLIIGAHHADPSGKTDAGSVYLYSGATPFIEICRLDGEIGDEFGTSVAGAGDINSDGCCEFIVGVRYADPVGRTNAGSAHVYSYDGLNSCSLLFQLDGEAAEDALGYSVANAGNVNGNGGDDFIVGALYADPGGLREAGSAYVFGLELALTASAASLSAAAGAVINYYIDFELSDAGVNYRLLGSATGTGPTILGGMRVPLTSGDWLWDAMLASPQPNVFQNGSGILDANGDATVTLTVPAGVASIFIGSTFYFAAGLYLPATYTGLKSSQAVSLTILP